MFGFLDVLNVGAGHLKFRFDKNDADEVAQAKKVIGDMLGRGYMLFVMIDGEQRRVRRFDPEHEEYILEEPDDLPAEHVEDVAEPAVKDLAEATPSPPPRRRGRPPGAGRRVPLREGRATAIGPSAGG